VSAQFILDVHILVRRNTDLLFLKRKNTGYMDGHYGVVGGHIEPDEPAPDAAVRELEEETGLSVVPGDLRLVHILQKFAVSPRLSFFFDLPLPTGQEPRNREPDKCDELLWAPLSRPPEPIIPYISVTLRRCAAKELFATYTEPG